MITRFDHAVVAVRDLAEASARFRGLGFDVEPGGEHPGLGTHNALIRFGLDYIELIAVNDVEAARSRGLGTGVLVDLLERGEEGLVGFALATDGIEAEAERVRRIVPGTVGPLAMNRRTPLGELLGWRLLIRAVRRCSGAGPSSSNGMPATRSGQAPCAAASTSCR
ncbi:MAG: VOC family protein [Dehalococcoidia bacterium]